QLAYENARRRGGCAAGGQSRISTAEPEWDDSAVEQVVGDEPTPEFAAQVAEQCQRLLDLLDDQTLRRIAVWKMEGFTNEEIAGQLGCSRRTVSLKLAAIRVIWSKEPAP